MKKIYILFIILFSLKSYSQIIYKVNDSITNGKFSVSPDFPKVIIIETETQKMKFDDVFPGKEMYDYYTLYSNDHTFRFDIYHNSLSVIVYVRSRKSKYIKLYNIELKSHSDIE